MHCRQGVLIKTPPAWTRAAPAGLRSVHRVLWRSTYPTMMPQLGGSLSVDPDLQLLPSSLAPHSLCADDRDDPSPLASCSQPLLAGPGPGEELEAALVSAYLSPRQSPTARSPTWEPSQAPGPICTQREGAGSPWVPGMHPSFSEPR